MDDPFGRRRRAAFLAGALLCAALSPRAARAAHMSWGNCGSQSSAGSLFPDCRVSFMYTWLPYLACIYHVGAAGGHGATVKAADFNSVLGELQSIMPYVTSANSGGAGVSLSLPGAASANTPISAAAWTQLENAVYTAVNWGGAVKLCAKAKKSNCSNTCVSSCNGGPYPWITYPPGSSPGLRGKCFKPCKHCQSDSTCFKNCSGGGCTWNSQCCNWYQNCDSSTPPNCTWDCSSWACGYWTSPNSYCSPTSCTVNFYPTCNLQTQCSPLATPPTCTPPPQQTCNCPPGNSGWQFFPGGY